MYCSSTEYDYFCITCGALDWIDLIPWAGNLHRIGWFIILFNVFHLLCNYSVIPWRWLGISIYNTL